MRTWSLLEGRWRGGENSSAEAWWFDIVGENDGLTKLAQRFGLHPLAVEDCYSKNLHVPKIGDFGEHLFIVLQIVTAKAGTDHIDDLEELDVVLGTNFLITHTDRAILDVEAVHGVLSESISVRPGADGLFHAIADRAVDAMLPKLNAIGDELDELQERVLRQPDPYELGTLRHGCAGPSSVDSRRALGAPVRASRDQRTLSSDFLRPCRGARSLIRPAITGPASGRCVNEMTQPFHGLATETQGSPTQRICASWLPHR